MGRINLQLVIALLAVLVIAVATGYVAFTATTVTVPDYGGSYVEGIAGNPHAINPVLSQSNPIDQDLTALVFTGLTRVGTGGELEPDLAQRWEISEDGMSYTFYLRDDVQWHDGAPFSASDVVFTIQTIQSPDFQGAPSLTDVWRNVTVEELGPYTLRFTLREPFAPFLDYTSIGILPAHLLNSVPPESLAESPFSASPVGTGPFCVEEVSARRILLVANKAFYEKRPYIDRLEFYFYSDLPSVFEARRRGECDGISRVMPEYLEAIREDPQLSLYSAPISGYNLVFLNLDRAVFQDRAVRQAMMWAIDRQKMVDEILAGQGIVIHSPILSYSWAYDADVQRYQHDLDKAQRVLEQAGWRDSDGDGIRDRDGVALSFTLNTNQDDEARMQLAQMISQQLAECGIQANVEPVSWDVLVSEKLRLRRYDAVLSGWQSLPPDPDPYPYWHSSQASEDGLNFANYIDKEADYLLATARSTADQEERAALYRRFQELFVEQVPSLLLYQPVYHYAVDSKVQNVQISSLIDSGDRFQTITDWYIASQRMLYSEAREQGYLDEER